MQVKPPEDSKIQYVISGDSIQYSWEPEELKPLRYFIAGMMIMGLPFVVFVSIKIVQGFSTEKAFFLRLFLFVMLFTSIMILPVFFIVLYFLLRPSKPVVPILTDKLLEYQTGYCSSEIIQFFDKHKKMLSLIKGLKNRTYSIPWFEIQNFQLRRIGVKQKLLFDYDGQAIEIGKDLTEPEREWLFEILREQIATGTQQ